MTSKVLQFLRHAFAVHDGEAKPGEAELAAAEQVCKAIWRRRMTVPALVFLESVRPLNYVSAQMMHFFAPFATAAMDASSYEAFARFLERRQSIDWMCRRLEELERQPGLGQENGQEPPRDAALTWERLGSGAGQGKPRKGRDCG